MKMPIYDFNKITPDFTNADYARQWFKDTIVTQDEYSDFVYRIDNEYSIVWLDGEEFTIDRHYYDHDVGYVSDDGLFYGDFGQCIDFIKKQYGMHLED